MPTPRGREAQPIRPQDGEKKIVLVVEDEHDISDLVRFHLEQEGFAVVVSPDGEKALEIARRQRPALVILDLMLPGTPGLEVCRLMRSDERLADVPIVMLTARAGEADRVVGLEMGADDYVTKPFSPKALVARVKALLRRLDRKAEDGPSRYAYGELTMDLARHEIMLKGKEVSLTAKEFGLLEHLLRNPGRVLTRDVLLNAVWGYDYFGTTRTVDVHIRRLKQKLPLLDEAIVSVKSLGYKLKEQ